MLAELIIKCDNTLGEGLFHDELGNCLWWVDIAMPSRLYRLDYATGNCRHWDMSEMISYAVPKASGGMLIASHGGLNAFDPITSNFSRIKQIEPMQPFNRSNDSCCDPQGRLWVGTMLNNIAPDNSPIRITSASGGFYRIDKELNVTKMCSDIEISNSLCFSPDSETIYFCDTPTNMIWAHDFNASDGTFSNRREFASHERGLPDGATMDSEGGLWSARYGGGCVVRFLPGGQVDQVIDVPCSQITCCTFGGPDLDTLYITTARIDLNENQLAKEPQAGGLFASKPGVHGIADTRFAG